MQFKRALDPLAYDFCLDSSGRTLPGAQGGRAPLTFLLSRLMGGYSALQTLSCFWPLHFLIPSVGPARDPCLWLFPWLLTLAYDSWPLPWLLVYIFHPKSNEKYLKVFYFISILIRGHSWLFVFNKYMNELTWFFCEQAIWLWFIANLSTL